MKIAVFHDLPSGGAKRTLYESMKRLSKRHTLDVYTLDTADKDFCNLDKFSNVEFVYHFSPSRLFESPFGRLNQLQRWIDLQKLDRLARKIAKAIDERKYDILFAQPCMWTQAPLVLRYVRTPSLYFCHESLRHAYEVKFRTADEKTRLQSIINKVDPLIRLYQTTVQRLDKSATRSAKRVLVNSKFTYNNVKQIYGIDPIISYTGVDTEVFKPRSGYDRKQYVLSVGAIQPHKGYDFLIESFSHIDKRIRPPLYLIGNMDNSREHSILQTLADEREVELHIEVGIEQNTLVKRYNEAMFVAYAPYNEPFGLVPLEAMACGKPVVGIDEGGVIETVIDKVTGLLVERNAQQFGESMQLLLESPELIKEYGSNGRNQVMENWSWDKSVSDLEQNMLHILD